MERLPLCTTTTFSLRGGTTASLRRSSTCCLAWLLCPRENWKTYCSRFTARAVREGSDRDSAAHDLIAAKRLGFSGMIKKHFYIPLHSFPTIPIFSLPCGQGDVLIVSDQNTVGWYIGLHSLVDRRAHELQQWQLFNNTSCVYVQARRNGWVVSVAYTLSFFEIRGRLHRNYHLRSRGVTLQSRRAA